MARATPTRRGPKRGDPPGRKASKEVRRLQLIEATIDSLATRGFSETTMADVARGAGLSHGIVNFHFDSKEKLLIATLQHMADEYADHWRAAVDKAGADPANRLWALVVADFDRRICSLRKLAAWCAFWGEARSRPTYLAHCGARDKAYQAMLEDLFRDLGTGKGPGDPGSDPASLALAFGAMLEGLWMRLMMGDGMTRQRAMTAARCFLHQVSPRQFPVTTPSIEEEEAGLAGDEPGAPPASLPERGKINETST